MADVFTEILKLREKGIPAALATIIGTKGSTPGREAMRLLVREDGTFVGTVGGGCLEAEVFEAAKEVMRDEKTRTLSFRLNEFDTPENGLLCGGEVTVFVEPLTVPSLHIFGGGHISRVLAQVAAIAGFRVEVYEDREAFVSEERFPSASALHCGDFREQAQNLFLGPLSYVVVVTRGHKGDGEVLLGLSQAQGKARYVGMIGSRTKKRVLFRKLEEEGVPVEWLARVHSPVGLDIGAMSHEEICISILAEMIAERRGKLGAERVLPSLSREHGRS
ncbi:MAG TPA: xanthine dehydrogenase [Planctomycetes bacterium]|nr:xanthine dehydrogenase [Planctomycetota bacterium]